MTHDDDLTELSRDIAEAVLKAKKLGLNTVTYILRMALLEALEGSIRAPNSPEDNIVNLRGRVPK